LAVSFSFGVPLCPSRPSGSPASSGGLLLFPLPGRCAARCVRPPLRNFHYSLSTTLSHSFPLAWRPSPAVPSPCWPWPPRRARGPVHPRGSPLRFSGRARAAGARVGTLCTSAGRWGTPANACCTARRVRRPSAPWPGLPPPSALNVLVPAPFAHPRGAPPAFVREGSGGRC
jgi:hypothetical protein